MASAYEVPDSQESDTTLTASEAEEPEAAAARVLKPKLKMIEGGYRSAALDLTFAHSLDADEYGIIGCRLVYPKGSAEAAVYKEKMKQERASARAVAAPKTSAPKPPKSGESAKHQAACPKKGINPPPLAAGNGVRRALVDEVPDSEEDDEMLM